MGRKYWLARSDAAIGMAHRATTAEARLIHYELAGMYSIKASRSTSCFMLSRKGPATTGEHAALANPMKRVPQRPSDRGSEPIG